MPAVIIMHFILYAMLALGLLYIRVTVSENFQHSKPLELRKEAEKG